MDVVNIKKLHINYGVPCIRCLPDIQTDINLDDAYLLLLSSSELRSFLPERRISSYSRFVVPVLEPIPVAQQNDIACNCTILYQAYTDMQS